MRYPRPNSGRDSLDEGPGTNVMPLRAPRDFRSIRIAFPRDVTRGTLLGKSKS